MTESIQLESNQTENKHILLTGANSALARAFVDAQTGSRIYVVDTHFDEPITGATQVIGDLRDPHLLADIMGEVKTIIHLAPLYTDLGSAQETLDHTVQGTYQLATAAADAEVSRFILGSTLDQFGVEWSRYQVNESWRPRPEPKPAQLPLYLAEVTLREVARVTGLASFCLRLGNVIDTPTAHNGSFDPFWLHVEDAVSAILSASTVDEPAGWRVYHIGAKGDHTAVASDRAEKEWGYLPQHDFRGRWPEEMTIPPMKTVAPISTRPIRKIVVFGAGGPLGSVVASELAGGYELHLTDLQSIDWLLAKAEPQAPGAPLPVAPSPPHTWQAVNVCDIQQVMAACEGADAVINLAVARYGVSTSFRVNMLGAYNVMAAAVAHGIHRVVHTGPYMMGDRGAFGYDWDTYIVDDAPPRPGIGWVYIPSKLAGQEICRIYAEHFGLSVPALGFAQFVNPEVKPPHGVSPLAVSWEDAARAVRAALEVETLPRAYEYFHIGVDLPHGVFPIEKAHSLLGWQARDLLEEFYGRFDER
jgi:nucleoside-diphosphate-sugar epimerase